VYSLAVAHRITGYDAVYLELALRKNLPLATLDEDLARACRAAGGAVM
jgi:predicted nucleic acid-binding protein